jgi:hypothetical protein
MKLYLRRNAPLFYAIAAMLALYIPWLNRGYSNWEWPHVLAGEALAYPEKIGLLDAYWSTGQANPLGYPLFNALLQRLVPWTDAPWLWRVPSLVGCGLIVTWGWLVRDEFGKNPLIGFYTWTVLLLTNPMIAVFSTHASSDILPVGLLLISFWILFQFSKTENYYQLLSSATLFGLSSVTRYIAPYFVGYVIYILLKSGSTRRRLLNLTVFGLVTSTFLISEIAWKFLSFDVLISTRLAANGPNFLDISNWFHVLLKNLSFVGVFCGVLPLFLCLQRLEFSLPKLKHLAFAGPIIVFATVSTQPINEGELDFGLGQFIPPVVVSAIFFLGFLNFVAFVVCMINRAESKNQFKTAWLAGLISYLLLLSASRPTQRYLIYIVPIVLFFIMRSFNNARRPLCFLAVSTSVLLFASVSLVGQLFLSAQGNASERIAAWAVERDLIGKTGPGEIFPHAGQNFWGTEIVGMRYEIIAVTPSAEAQVKERILHREPMKVLGKVTRVYLLREIPVAP